MKFSNFDLKQELLKAIDGMGFETATPIQAQAISFLLEGRDIIGQARTGTGKTAAFGIPTIQNIDVSVKQVQAIILCPTRELAVQVSDELQKLGKYMRGLKTVPIFGGQDIVRQIKSLKSGAQIVVGTPGRTMDHMKRKTVSFDHVKMMVLDEADEMLNMGFREDIEAILAQLPSERQTVLFSATMPKAIVDIATNYQKNAEHIKVVEDELTVPSIEQFYYEVRPQDKVEVLTRVMDLVNPTLSVVFCNTKLRVDEVVSELQGKGYSAEGLHGDMNQAARLRVLTNCKQGRANVLVATDVAARGIDIESVDYVFNYDLPQDEEYYVHRIGRTGRAGRKGISFSFVAGRDIYKLRDIEKYCKTKIEKKPIPKVEEIMGTRVDQAFQDVREVLQNKKVAVVREAIAQMLETEEIDVLDLAAALLFKSANLDIQEINVSAEKSRKKSGDRDRDRDKKKSKAPEAGMTRVFLNVGKRDHINPGNILGAIAGEANISGSAVGNIDMYENYSFVDIPEALVFKVIKNMNGKSIKGRQVSLEISRKGGERSGDRSRDKSRDKKRKAK